MIIRRETIATHLLEKQLEMIGKDKLAMIDTQFWRFDFTMTLKQREEFKKYAMEQIKKTFHCNTFKAEETYKFFIDNFGVRIKG